MRKASLCEEVRSAGANSWMVSSVDMTLRKFAVLFAERNGDGLVAALLTVKQHIREKHAYLAHVHLVDESVEGEVHRLHRIHGVREDALPVGRHVHAGVGDGGLDDAEGWESAARVKDRSHTYRRELVALMVEADSDDPIGFLTVRSEKTVRMYR